MTNLSDNNVDIDGSNSARQGVNHQKRPYTKPILVKHGNLRDITMKVGKTGKTDGTAITKTG